MSTLVGFGGGWWPAVCGSFFVHVGRFGCCLVTTFITTMAYAKFGSYDSGSSRRDAIGPTISMIDGAGRRSATVLLYAFNDACGRSLAICSSVVRSFGSGFPGASVCVSFASHAYVKHMRTSANVTHCRLSR